MPAAPDALRQLVRALQRAHGGELAAALAYDGHAASVRDPAERAVLVRMAAEERAHRARAGAILTELGARPVRWRELAGAAVGRTVAVACRLGALLPVVGWYAAMDGAGRFEAKGVAEYARAARLAEAAGRADLAGDLLAMARSEHAHERWFRARCAESPVLHRLLPGWRRPEVTRARRRPGPGARSSAAPHRPRGSPRP